MKKLAPITLFVYNRLEHTKKTIDALKKNILAKQSELIIFSDAPKNKEDFMRVNGIRRYIKSIKGFKKIKVIERKENLGLAKSIILGVTKVVNEYNKIIVLEDDLITSKYFLKFMNEALDIYKDEKSVGSVQGYLYPIKETTVPRFTPPTGSSFYCRLV